MLDNNGPKDGDFVKYVEALDHARNQQGAVMGSTESSVATPSPATSARAELEALLRKHQQNQLQRPAEMDDASDDTGLAEAPATSPVMPPLDTTTKKNFAELIRAVALVFVAFVFIAPILPEPFNVIARLAAIFYVIYVLRKMGPALQGLRTRLEEISRQQDKR